MMHCPNVIQPQNTLMWCPILSSQLPKLWAKKIFLYKLPNLVYLVTVNKIWYGYCVEGTNKPRKTGSPTQARTLLAPSDEKGLCRDATRAHLTQTTITDWTILLKSVYKVRVASDSTLSGHSGLQQPRFCPLLARKTLDLKWKSLLELEHQLELCTYTVTTKPLLLIHMARISSTSNSKNKPGRNPDMAAHTYHLAFRVWGRRMVKLRPPNMHRDYLKK